MTAAANPTHQGIQSVSQAAHGCRRDAKRCNVGGNRPRGPAHTQTWRATCPSSAAAFEPASGPDAAEPRAALLTCGHSEAEQSQGRWVADAGAACRRRHLMVGLLDAPSLCKRQALVGNSNKVCLGHVGFLVRWCELTFEQDRNRATIASVNAGRGQ